VLLGTAFAGCWSETRIDGLFSEGEWAYLQSYRLPPLDPCPPRLGFAAGAPCDEAAALGKALFFDASFSGPLTIGNDGLNGGLGAAGETGKVSCGSCHQPDAWFADKRSRPNATSLGAAWTGRNATSLVNAAYQRTFLMHGEFVELAPLLVVPLTKPPLLNSNKAALAAVMRSRYVVQYDAVFDPDIAASDDEQIFVAASRAIEAYERRLVSGNSPLDRYLGGEDFAAISDSAKRGLALFIGPALCSECHDGPLLGDGEFRNTGVQQHRPGAAISFVPAEDLGRGRQTMDAVDNGKFRTPGLRQIAETPPYMHAGQIETLAGVVEFYRWGGDDAGFVGVKDPMMQPLEITDEDAADLVAFLRTLTGDPIPMELRP
jgi:cytochrome c peroxidase